MNDEKYKVLSNLSQSITHLEYAILSARTTLLNRPNCPPEAIRRLESYLKIVDKQRKILPQILAFIDANNYDDLIMAVKRTNGLSSMIREDAVDLMGELSTPSRKHSYAQSH